MEALNVSAITVGIHLIVKTSVSTEKAPEIYDTSTCKEGEASAQGVGCKKCPDPSGEQVSTCKI